ncbi:MAG: hypothetical protein KA040_03780 [Aliarcobacter sp.]|nr:hypothetical protein [Aliarcobacter sp.]
MNIYIYGNNSFKKEIHETLEHSNIKFKLDESTLIKEIDDLSQLKQTIKNNPKDIYLIDDERIIKKNSLNKKIKFFTPKDGIEEEFLLDSGISDLSINSLSEIPKYILRKYDEEKKMNSNIQEVLSNNSIEDDGKENTVELDDELAQLLAKEESIQEIKVNKNFDGENLEELFDMRNDINLGDPENMFDTFDNIDNNSIEISKNEFDDIMNFNDSFGLNNISFDYDDEAVGNDEAKDKEEFMDFNFGEEIENDDEEDNEVFEDLDFLEDMFSDKKEKILDNKKKELKKEVSFNESLQGEKSMSNDEFFELDSLNEKDLLEALNYTNSSLNQDKSGEIDLLEKSSNTISVTSSSNTDELAQLISKLLSNKTLEITIKIKD